MQITSLLATDSTASSTSTSSKAMDTSGSESFLLPGDVKMLEYVTDTTSLSEALKNPHAKVLADSINDKRQHGYVPGNVEYSSIYMPAQLSESDAKMVESMTGTTNIIDAQNAGNQGVDDLIGQIGFDRSYKFVSGDLTTDYVNQMISFDKDQTTLHGGAGISVNVDTLNQALAYLQTNETGNSTRQLAPSYSTTV